MSMRTDQHGIDRHAHSDAGTRDLATRTMWPWPEVSGLAHRQCNEQLALVAPDEGKHVLLALPAGIVDCRQQVLRRVNVMVADAEDDIADSQTRFGGPAAWIHPQHGHTLFPDAHYPRGRRDGNSQIARLLAWPGRLLGRGLARGLVSELSKRDIHALRLTLSHILEGSRRVWLQSS